MQINYILMHLVIKNSQIKVFKLFIPLHINKIETLQLDIFLFKIMIHQQYTNNKKFNNPKMIKNKN